MSYTPAYAGSTPHTPERRRQLRKEINALAYIEIGEDNGGLIVDISENGLAVQAAMPLSDDQPAQLRFQLPGLDHWIEGRGRFAWKEKSGKQAGVEFVDLPEEARNQIRGLTSLGATPREAQAEDGRIYEEPAEYSTARTGPGQSPTSRILEPATTHLVVENKEPDSHSAAGNLTTTPIAAKSPSSLSELATIHSLIEKELLDSISTVHAATAPPVANESISSITKPTTDLSEERAEADPISSANPATAPSVAEVPISSISERVTSGGMLTKQVQDSVPESGADTFAGRGKSALVNSSPAAHISEAAKDLPTKQTREVAPPLMASRGTLAQRRWAVPVLAIAVVVLFFLAGTSFRRLLLSVPAQKVATLPTSAGVEGKQIEIGDSPERQPVVPVKISHTVPEVNQIRRAPQNLPVESQKAKSKLPAWTLSHPRITERSGITVGDREEYPTPVVGQQENPSLASQAMVAVGSPNSVPAPPEPRPEGMQQQKHLDPAYLLFRVEPVYPLEAQQRGVEGIVKMHAVIGTDGKVKSLTLVSGPPPLVAAAMSAGREWSYLPAILNGKPVESEQDISIAFRLPH